MKAVNDAVAGREVVQVDWKNAEGRYGERCRVVVWTPRGWQPGRRSTQEDDDAGREEALIFESVGGGWHLVKSVS